jgi:hypothetical protein
MQLPLRGALAVRLTGANRNDSQETLALVAGALAVRVGGRL